jgi:hypothetical protein
MSNVIFLEFFNKKSFPPGKWLSEPDLCHWNRYGMDCLAIRDMSLGVWKGFVGVNQKHSFYSKKIEEVLKMEETMEIFFSVYGGITSAGRLPPKYKDYAHNLWWIGIETSHGADFMPLLKLDMENPDMAKMLSHQTYKDFSFIRRETNKLSKCLSRIT